MYNDSNVYFKVLNVSNAIKVAVDFVSPFNATEMETNIDRIFREENREDYLGVNRTLHKGLTRALRVLQSADPLRQEAKEAKGKLGQVINS